MLEEQRLNEIKQRVREARLEFNASQIRGDEKYVAQAKEYFKVLEQSARDIDIWVSDIDSKTEMLSRPGTKVTHHNRKDPYFKLQANNVQFITELRSEKDDLKAWLDARESQQ